MSEVETWWESHRGRPFEDSDETFARVRCTVCAAHLPTEGPLLLSTSPRYDLEFDLCWVCYWALVSAVRSPAAQQAFDKHRAAVARQHLYRGKLGRTADYRTPTEPRLEEWMIGELRATEHGLTPAWEVPADEDGAA